MKLREVMPHTGSVKIGTEHGAGFVYCGSVDKYDDANVSDAFLRIMNRRLREKKTTLHLRKSETEGRRGIVLTEQCIKDFTRFLDREVVDCRMSIYPDTTIIIVTGNEAGLQWFEGDTG